MSENVYISYVYAMCVLDACSWLFLYDESDMFAGKEVLEILNELGTTEGRTKKKVTIYDCGVVSQK